MGETSPTRLVNLVRFCIGRISALGRLVEEVIKDSLQENGELSIFGWSYIKRKFRMLGEEGRFAEGEVKGETIRNPWPLFKNIVY